jgi:serine O-acetyltransferase
LFYLETDKIAQVFTSPASIKQKFKYFFCEDIYKFERLLRKTEYHLNCDKSLTGRVYTAYLWYKLNKAGLKLGFEINPNCFGPGLSIVHPGTIIVHPKARIGANCKIGPCVVIGTKAGVPGKVPTIGDNVFIGPGSKIFGDITIADGVAIGANSVVNRSILESYITVAGIPARKVNNKGSRGLLVNATEVVLEKSRKIDS